MPIKQNIWYAKERIWSLRYMLLFAQVPKNVIVYMVFNTTIIMNLFPRKGGNERYSPQAIFWAEECWHRISRYLLNRTFK